MALNDVKNAIQEKTKTEVEVLLQNGRAEAEKIIADAQEQIKRKQSEHDTQTKELLKAMERKEHATAQFKRKSLLLEEKRKAIDEVFERVRKQYSAMTIAERNSALTRLASQAAKTISVKTVHCNSADVATVKSLFKEATIVADDSVAGGFFVDDVTDAVRLDYTFDTILEQVREKHLAALIQKLFGAQ